MGRASKGSAFEREICGQLSLWWTEGKRDDVFWRAAQSGGRAKFRGRKGKDTHGQHGDILAVDPIGEPLIDLFTIELKRGYNTKTMFDLLDRPATAAYQKWEEWINQVSESMFQAGSYSFLLITKRDRRSALITMTGSVWDWLQCPGDDVIAAWGVMVRRDTLSKHPVSMRLVTIPLATFIEQVTPKQIRMMSKLC